MGKGKYTPGERDRVLAEATRLSARGVRYSEIAKVVGISTPTLRIWLENEYSQRAEHRANDRERAIARYEELIYEGWERLKDTKNTSMNVSGLINAIRQIQDSINKVTGIDNPAYREPTPHEEKMLSERKEAFTELFAEIEQYREDLAPEHAGPDNVGP